MTFASSDIDYFRCLILRDNTQPFRLKFVFFQHNNSQINNITVAVCWIILNYMTGRPLCYVIQCSRLRGGRSFVSGRWFIPSFYRCTDSRKKILRIFWHWRLSFQKQNWWRQYFVGTRPPCGCLRYTEWMVRTSEVLMIVGSFCYIVYHRRTATPVLLYCMLAFH